MVREGKQSQEIHEEKTELTVKIGRAFMIGENRRYKDPNYGKIVLWTNTEERYATEVVKVSKRNSCRFDTKMSSMPLESHERYLYIELLRGPTSSSDIPRTSNGVIVMGRAKVKLSARNCCGRKIIVDLVGLNSDGCIVEKGILELSLELIRYVVKD